MDREINNPYRPYDLESGKWFFHKNVIKKIKQVFEGSPENRFILLHGSPGSGKTSTLKQIEKSPELLGSNYIPIYLDSRKYTGLNADDLLFSVSIDAIEKLGKFGYKIKKPERRYMRGKTLDSIVLLLDSYLNREDEVLVFIFDEFDSLLEKIDSKIISDYIKYASFIEKNWSKYGLILAGDRGLINLTSSKTINQFLDIAPKINLEEFLEEENVKNLIVEPVKDQLTYDDDAIQKIIWYSGKNLYFQQLICYNIVEHLNKENRNHCSIKDVDEVIQRILKEEKPEFGYAWKNKLSIKAKIIASALADENITEKKGKFYFIKKNNLLDDIFREELSREIKSLQDFGYFHEMQERRFNEFPFKVPLYGQWVQREHPFIKTIIEHIEDIADKIDLKRLVNEVKSIQGTELPIFDTKATLQIAKKWCLLIDSIAENRRLEDKNQVKIFFIKLFALLNLNMKDNPQSDLNYFLIDIKNLGIGTLSEAYCLMQDRPEMIEDDITNIERIATSFAQDSQTRFTLFFYFQESDRVKDLVKKTYLNLVVIDESDLKKIIFSNRPVKTFRKIVLSRLSLQQVSPYQTSGVTKVTFYGRNKIINQIIGSTKTSFTIVGSRKIGKTSLLYKIKDDPPSHTIYIFMNLEIKFLDKNKYENFFRSLDIEIRRIFKKEVDFGALFFSNRLYQFPEIIRELTRNGKRIVFIIDEIDHLIEFDKKHKYKLMKIFRAMSQDNICQFIFVGFNKLYHSKRDIEHPLYNFCEEIILDPLEKEAALDLITKPMESIGIRYENDNIRHLILEYTACHPNLIQFFCKKLVEKIETHDKVEDRRIILEKDIEELFNTEYEKYLMDQMYMFFSDLSNLERLTLVLLAEEHLINKRYFSIQEIKDKLTAHGIRRPTSTIHRILRNFVLRFILVEKEMDSYCFALSVFPELLKNKIDAPYKKKMIKEIKRDKIIAFLRYFKTALKRK